MKKERMSVEEAIPEDVPGLRVDGLPAGKQLELLSHATSLRQETNAPQPFQSVKGLWAGLGIDLSAEDIDANQAGMWRNFPSDDIE